MWLVQTLDAAGATTPVDGLSRGLSIAALGVAALAFLVALVTLWRTHLAKMHVVVAVGAASVRMSHIEADNGAEWFLPAIDLRASIANTGARAGRIVSMRIRADYVELPIPNAKEYFPLFAEVESAAFAANAKDRFSWIDAAVVGLGAPFVSLPKTSVEKHLVFDTRWDDPVLQKIQFALELYTDSKKKWVQIETWTFEINAAVWRHLLKGGTFTTWPDKHPANQFRMDTIPEDLHKYTGSKEPIPEGDLFAHDSWLKQPGHRVEDQPESEA